MEEEGRGEREMRGVGDREKKKKKKRTAKKKKLNIRQGYNGHFIFFWCAMSAFNVPIGRKVNGMTYWVRIESSRTVLIKLEVQGLN
jgi:hypothetical protein